MDWEGSGLYLMLHSEEGVLRLGLGLDERGSHTGSHAEARMCWLVLDILCCTFFCLMELLAFSYTLLTLPPIYSVYILLSAFSFT